MIEPGGIPQYTGDFDKLATAVSQLRTYATGIRNNGQDVHSRFQAVAGYYKAPEAEQLFSSTRPVMDTADTFATHIESLADALDVFAAEAKPHADRLKQLKLDAIAFVDEVQGDDGWTKDQHKVDRDQALWDGVNEARVAFQDAERRAANKIEAIAPAECRPAWIVDDGTHAKGMYGESADMLKDIGTLPWGSPDERTYERWSLDWWGHGARSWAWDGLAKDSIWGGIDGIGTLLGYHGQPARDQAWDGLRRTFVGAYAYGMEELGEGEHLSSWQRDSKAYAKEFGKQFVAYDMWKKDPARAHAVVFFNFDHPGFRPRCGRRATGQGRFHRESGRNRGEDRRCTRSALRQPQSRQGTVEPAQGLPGPGQRDRPLPDTEVQVPGRHPRPGPSLPGGQGQPAHPDQRGRHAKPGTGQARACGGGPRGGGRAG
ncbi:hypothetical protein [Streptomyces sp. NPDC051994]|uniref:hypothetical protein n=1 Tax=unclassified Streptomyces TaxID=2593676 RepID=UPI00342724D0